LFTIEQTFDDKEEAQMREFEYKKSKGLELS